MISKVKQTIFWIRSMFGMANRSYPKSPGKDGIMKTRLNTLGALLPGPF